LAEICREIQPRTWHVETEAELQPGWFEGCRAVGISAGASTPDNIVGAAILKLEAFASERVRPA
ncbi:MAG: 4-hydroxy-3-methylbut-2-enyl diphosphate reductase, partial [Candidatus Aminicenantes bacterium]|nr:4-hydroxy-3-methylbut-2-enyl diphosphate reductase [Candidatus Aminicenantes bacterium]